MTVEKNIAVVPEILGWDAERIHTRVTDAGLVNLNPERYRNRYPAQLFRRTAAARGTCPRTAAGRH